MLWANIAHAEESAGIEITVTGLDTIPPAAVTDLSATSPTANSLTLIWTVPGDDGNSGTAAQYDIRYSNSPIITEAGWDAATQVADELAPKMAGSTETFVVSGLGPATRSARTTPLELEVNLWGTVASGSMDEDGVLRESIEVTSADGRMTIQIPEGTQVLGPDGKPLDLLKVTALYPPPPSPPDGYHIVAALHFKPDGATLVPPIQITVQYDEGDIPEGVDEANLVIAFLNEAAGEWVFVPAVVDTAANTVTFSTSHFSVFAILVAAAPTPTPPINWPLIGGIIGAVMLLALISYLRLRRRGA